MTMTTIQGTERAHLQPRMVGDGAPITDRSALAATMTSILVSAFGLYRAALWEGKPGTGKLLARSGPCRPLHDPRFFLLGAPGAAQAWIEIETKDGDPPGGTFEQFLPLLEVVLSAVPLPPDPGALRAARVDAARARWGLTPRQTEVLARVARGLANRDIADDLDVAEGTVEIHVTQILKKAGAENRASLVARIWDG